MQGKIVKGIAGFYYVHTEDGRVFECKAKGVFRNRKIRPLVGDNVDIDILDEAQVLGSIVDVLPRKNTLIRPAVANVDQALIIFAAAHPNPNYNLLDRFIIMMRQQSIETIICFNKTDLADESRLLSLTDIYKDCGCRLIFVSAAEGRGAGASLMPVLEGKTTVLAGPSGVGKSSLTNILLSQDKMEVGEVSFKIGRGRHTTRHSELINIEGNTYIMDTPGFTSLYVNGVEACDLKNYFEEFIQYDNMCRFNGCVHIGEPGCAVKQAVSNGLISRIRYNSYVGIYNELNEQRKYR